jgi:uncharacterized protein YjbI with pentapeptide repeats
MANQLALDILKAALEINYWGWANLSGANLSKADLRWADLSGANLSGADLHWADLSGADLHWANLSGADLRGADLRGAHLSGAILIGADLLGAHLRGADLHWANLSGADLSGANLRGADLSEANLSGTTGLLNPQEWIEANFKYGPEGLTVFKAIGNTSFPPNPAWIIAENSVISEEVNYCRTNDCGCGVNFGTLEFCRQNYPNSQIWECVIEPQWLCMVVVPYNTDGKARCGKMRLLKKLEA